MAAEKEIKTWPYEGEDRTQCKGCGADIYYMITNNGKKMPVDYSDEQDLRVCHFVTCPNANDFRSKRTK